MLSLEDEQLKTEQPHKLSDLNEERRLQQKLGQNADPCIINIYIYMKPGESWILKLVFYAFCLLIIVFLSSERQTVNTFGGSLTVEVEEGLWRSVYQ